MKHLRCQHHARMIHVIRWGHRVEVGIQSLSHRWVNIGEGQVTLSNDMNHPGVMVTPYMFHAIRWHLHADTTTALGMFYVIRWHILTWCWYLWCFYVTGKHLHPDITPAPLMVLEKATCICTVMSPPAENPDTVIILGSMFSSSEKCCCCPFHFYAMEQTFDICIF